MHGWAHEQWSQLDAATERELATQATRVIADAIGETPKGFRAPGGARTDATADILADLGYEYDASLGNKMQPARLGNGLPNVPFVWPGVDGYWYLRDEPEDPVVVRDAWLASLNKAELFLTICHPEITAIDKQRLAALDAIVAAVAPNATTVGAIAARIPA
jgi:peptidoglycan/xylan/chitin deacetylase (PgdA/CDA1 family)